ncbi:MAG: AAA family ATPase [Actinomycetota bacterium]
MSEARIFAIGSPPTFKQQVARALDMDPDSVGWLSSVTAAEELLVSGQEWADVLVLSTDVKDPDALGLADFVGRSFPTTAVLLVRDRAPIGLLPAAMRAGIRDVVDLSRGTHELTDALERAIAWSQSLHSLTGGDRPTESANRGMVISIFSSKGGTGKTFLACNLAAAIAQKARKDTAIVDLDLRIGDVFSYFGTEPSHPLEDLMALADKVDRDTILQTGTPLYPNLWAFGALPNPAAESVPGQAAGKLLRALRSAFAFTIVDAAAEYSDQVLAGFDLADEICLVTGLDVVGTKHLSIAIDTLLSLGMARDQFRVVLNRADSKVGLTIADVERVLKVKVDATIPSSQLVPISLNKGRPVVVDEPKSDVADAVGSLAERLIGMAGDIIVESPTYTPAASFAAKSPVLRLFGIG